MIDCHPGELSWAGMGSPEATADYLDLLLTGGRLTPKARAVVTAALRSGLTSAQKATSMTAEFNTYGTALPLTATRPLPRDPVHSTPRSYRAIIMVFFAGGAE